MNRIILFFWTMHQVMFNFFCFSAWSQFQQHQRSRYHVLHQLVIRIWEPEAQPFYLNFNWQLQISWWSIFVCIVQTKISSPRLKTRVLLRKNVIENFKITTSKTLPKINKDKNEIAFAAPSILQLRYHLRIHEVTNTLHDRKSTTKQN